MEICQFICNTRTDYRYRCPVTICKSSTNCLSYVQYDLALHCLYFRDMW